MKNKYVMYSIKFAKHINDEILRAKTTLGDRAEAIVYGEFQEAVKDYLSGPTICTDEEFVGFFHKYVGFAITSHSAKKQLQREVVTAPVVEPMLEESVPTMPSTPWYEDRDLIK